MLITYPKDDTYSKEALADTMELQIPWTTYRLYFQNGRLKKTPIKKPSLTEGDMQSNQVDLVYS
jgi:hypothetical protein